MKRFIATLIVFGAALGILATMKAKAEERMFKASDTTKCVIAEKTSSGIQSLLAPLTGNQHYLILSMAYFCASANNMYCFQYPTAVTNTSVASTYYVTPKIPFGQNGGLTPPFLMENKVLDKGNGLEMWTSADPNEGWYEIHYRIINYDDVQG